MATTSAATGGMPAARAFSTVLVANRGEIACRIIRSAHALGYRTVAVYSDADADALHVRMADVAARLGEAPAHASYLAIDRLIDAARRTGADAVHPGYGFLSENAAYARACQDAGLVFIGPPAEAMRLMGNKALAKRLMADADVPTIPGWTGEGGPQGKDQDEAALLRAAQQVGYPLLIKAAAGGGGRGMRLCASATELSTALRTARAEAESAFGSGELLLERALAGVRHVEVQIFADAHGNVVHLGERDCSVQRRHQKIVEEAPSPAVDEELRRRMGATAVKAARAIGYVGAGTVELLLDAGGAFYFMEMNTRLQVEHPVTEMITGLDLVALQLRVAAGERLPFTQDDVVRRGHAIEARLYAEDPYQGFAPRTGRVLRFLTGVPGTEEGRVTDGKRIDHGLHVGQEITAFYDPLLAKLVAWGETRELARRKLSRLIADTVLLGVTTNKPFLAEVLAHPEFAAGRATTSFITDHLCPPGAAAPERAASPGWLDAAAAVLLSFDANAFEGPAATHRAPPFVSTGEALWPLRYAREDGDGRLAWVRLVRPGHYLVTSDGGDPVEIALAGHDAPGEVRIVAGAIQHRVHTCRAADGTLFVDTGGRAAWYREVPARSTRKSATAGDGRVLAPMNGRVVSLHVAAGDIVAPGQVVAVLEAMKMLCPVAAEVNGRVSEVLATAEAQVTARQLLVQITPDAAAPPPPA